MIIKIKNEERWKCSLCEMTWIIKIETIGHSLFCSKNFCQKFKEHIKNCECEYLGYITDNIHNHYVDCVKCHHWFVH